MPHNKVEIEMNYRNIKIKIHVNWSLANFRNNNFYLLEYECRWLAQGSSLPRFFADSNCDGNNCPECSWRKPILFEGIERWNGGFLASLAPYSSQILNRSCLSDSLSHCLGKIMNTVLETAKITTSFPSSFPSASICCWEKDPCFGCTRDHPESGW